jgi:hypothetical protein
MVAASLPNASSLLDEPVRLVDPGGERLDEPGRVGPVAVRVVGCGVAVDRREGLVGHR